MTRSARSFFDEQLGINSGDIEGPVTYRYVEMEMLCEWGIPPWVYDAAPHGAKREMFKWYSWRNTRRRAQRDLAKLNAEHFKK